MVANLTVGKKGYEEAWEELAAMAERGQALKDRLARAVDDDTDAFNRVMEAMRLPKGTPEQQAERARAIEAANKAAAEVPLQTARLCLEAIALAATRRRARQPQLGVGCRRGGPRRRAPASKAPR